MSRRTRTLLLTATNLLYPKVPESVTEKLKLKRRKAKWYHDRSSRTLPEIEIGQDIRVALCRKIRPGKQTPVPEQKQMSSRLPAVKKTRTRVVKPPSRCKDFVA